MPAATPASTEPSPTATDSWPWTCLGCDATLYHDALYCADCRAHERSHATATTGSSSAFTAWVREQSYPEFVSTVTVVAGLEVGLTAFWLRLLLTGSVVLPGL